MRPMYRINLWNNTYAEIVPVTVTANTVTVRLAKPGHRGNDTERENRVSSRTRWVDTEKEAMKFLADRFFRKIEHADAEIVEAQKQLAYLSNGELRVKMDRFA